MKCILLFCALLAVASGRTIDVYKPRVVNGEEAKLGERPFQISMQQVQGSYHLCGGSILNEYWIVTAAHCVYGKIPRVFKIVVGMVDLKEPFSEHLVEKITIHEGYNKGDSYRNDIALMKVATPFQFSDRVAPVPLPQPHASVKTNSSVIVSGWGQTLTDPNPQILQKAEVFIADPVYCSTVVKERNMNVYPTNICANNPTTRRGECFGDSGGPVTVDGVLEGIVSWSIKDPNCGSPRYPGVHTRVSEYIDWIEQNMQ